MNLRPLRFSIRRWAQRILQTALDRLRQEYATRGQAALFDILQDYQPREPGGRSYAQLGEDLGMTEAAVKWPCIRCGNAMASCYGRK